jgi:hypothetical protein
MLLNLLVLTVTGAAPGTPAAAVASCRGRGSDGVLI